MKFQVFDNNKPADVNGYPNLKDYGWDNSIFSTFDKALKYARNWLNLDKVLLQVNVPYDYNGYGDMIEIRKIDTINT